MGKEAEKKVCSITCQSSKRDSFTSPINALESSILLVEGARGVLRPRVVRSDGNGGRSALPYGGAAGAGLGGPSIRCEIRVLETTPVSLEIKIRKSNIMGTELRLLPHGASIRVVVTPATRPISAANRLTTSARSREPSNQPLFYSMMHCPLSGLGDLFPTAVAGNDVVTWPASSAQGRKQ